MGELQGVSNPSENKPQRIEDLKFDKNIDDIITAPVLTALSGASGFYHYPDFKLAHDYFKDHIFKSGYTILQTKGIFYNPLMLGSRDAGFEPWEDWKIRGFMIHECGHHAKDVVKLQDKVLSYLTDPTVADEIIPKEYRGDPVIEHYFITSVYSHIGNAGFDVWLERYMAREPYVITEASLRELNDHNFGDIPRGLSLPEQFCQLWVRVAYAEESGLLRQMLRMERPDVSQNSVFVKALEEDLETLPERTQKFEELSEKINERSDLSQEKKEYAIKDLERQILPNRFDPIVIDTYIKLVKSGSIQAFMDRRIYDGGFPTPNQVDDLIDNKYKHFKDNLLPEYLKLIQIEVDARAKGGGHGMPPRDEAVPYTTKEVIKALIDFLDKLMEDAKRYAPGAPSSDESRHQEEAFRDLLRELEGKDRSQKPQEEDKGPKGLEAIQREADKLRREREDLEAQKLAEKMGIKKEAVLRLKSIKENFTNEISTTANAFAEIFLDDRRFWWAFLRREGETVPGLEYEEDAAIDAGDLEPQTRMELLRNTEFLETELEFIIDVSGSMSGEKLRKSLDTVVITVESFKQTLDLLRSEELLNPDTEQPFKVGVTIFDTQDYRVVELDDPLSEDKELKIVNALLETRGGTDEKSALRNVYKGLKLRSNNTIKLITVFTDGVGNRQAVAPIIRQVEQDDQVVFLVVAFGDSAEDAQAVAETYLSPLSSREKNVHAIVVTNPIEALPKTVDFYRRMVSARRKGNN